MAYIKIIYQNSPSTATPINAENLNHMDDQIALNDQRLTDLEGAHVSSFNGRAGAVSPEGGDYDIGQIAPLAGATVGQVPVVVNVGTEEDPELKFAMGQGGGGGHTIVDQSGTELAQEPNMTFVDAHLSDNSTDESTDIEIIQSVSESDWESATEDGLYDVDIDGAEIGSASDEYVEVTADGTKTFAQLLAELYAKVDFNKLSASSYLKRTNSGIISRLTNIGTNYIQFGTADGTSSDARVVGVKIASQSTDCSFVFYSVSAPSTISKSDATSTAPSEGAKIQLYYGNKSAVIDLQTTANRCLMNDGSTVQNAIDDKIIKRIIDTGEVTVPANSVVSIEVTAVSGYTPYSVVYDRASATLSVLSATLVRSSSNNYYVFIYNGYSSAASTGTSKLIVYYVKD